MSNLTREARRLVTALDDLGFNADDDSISGADTVDVIANYIDLLNKLPALAELSDAVGTFLQPGDITQRYDALKSAFDNLEKS